MRLGHWHLYSCGFVFRATVDAACLLAIASGTVQGQAECKAGGASTRQADIGITALVTEATTNARTFGADGRLILSSNPTGCAWRNRRFTLSVSPSYDEKRKSGAAPTITRVYAVLLQELVYLPGNSFYLSANARGLSNNSLGVYLQQTYDVRIGRLWSSSHTQLELNAGPAYVAQHYSALLPTTDFVAAAGSALLSHTFGAAPDSGKPDLRPILQLDAFDFHALSEANKSYQRYHGSLFVPLKSRIALTLSAFDDHLSTVPAGFKNSYFTSSLTLNLKLLP